MPVLVLADRELDLERGVVRAGEQIIPLTALELRFLTTLVAREGRPLSAEEALRTVWGYRVGVESRAVALLVSRLRKKLEIDPEDPRVLVSVYGQGYRLEVDDRAREIAALVARLSALDRAANGPEPAAAIDELGGLVPTILRAIPHATPEQEARLQIGLATWQQYQGPGGSPARLLELAETLTDPELALECRAVAVRLGGKTGLPEIIAQAALVSLDQPTVRLQRLALELHISSARRREVDESVWTELLERARRLGDRLQEAFVLDARGSWLARRAPSEEAIRCFYEAIRLAGADRFAAPIRNNLAVACNRMGRFEEALEQGQRAAASFERHHLPGRAAFCWCNVANHQIGLGRLEAAAVALERAFSLARLAGDEVGPALGHLIRLRLAVFSADPREVARLADETRFAASRQGHASVAVFGELYRAWARAMLGEREVVPLLDGVAAQLATVDEGAAVVFARRWAAILTDPAAPHPSELPVTARYRAERAATERLEAQFSTAPASQGAPRAAPV